MIMLLIERKDLDSTRTLAIWLFAALCGLGAGPAVHAQEECLACHGETGLEASDGRSLFVDPGLFPASPHGQASLSCTDCHGGADGDAQGDAPHPVPLPSAACADCHAETAAAHAASLHQQAGVACTSCHQPHAPGPGLDVARRSALCMDCHASGDSHAWLPEKSRHEAVIECAACHASSGKRELILELQLRGDNGLRPLTPEERGRLPKAPEPAAAPGGAPGHLSSEQLDAWLADIRRTGLGEVQFGAKLVVLAPGHDLTTKPAGLQTCQPCHSPEAAFVEAMLLQAPAGNGSTKLLPVARTAVPMRSMGTFARSLHGRAGIACLDCHDAMADLHAVQRSGTERLDELACKSCHTAQFVQYKDSVHARISDKLCFGCHDPHANQPFRAMRGEERQAICLQCHQNARHAWLPQEKLHMQYLECTSCHSPQSRKGISFTFEAAETGKQLGPEILQAMGFQRSEELLDDIDRDGSRVASADELIGFLQRLSERLPQTPRLRPEVLILEAYHDFSKGPEATRQCHQCHSANAEFYDKLFVQLPAPGGGVTSLAVEREILGRMQSAAQLGELYLLGESRISREDVQEIIDAFKRIGYRWIDILGVLALLGSLGFVGGHVLLRLLTIPKRRTRP
jgi:predicted CXXCH cytochrome family protein